MPGGHGGDVNRCRGDCADEQDETEAERGERDVRARGADRVSYDANGRGDLEPAEHRVERPPDLQVERHVEDLDQSKQAEQDSSDRGHDPSRPGRQQHRDSHQGQPFHGDAGKGGGGELEDTVGRDENTPHQQDRKHGEGQPQSLAGARAGTGAVQPDHVAAERLGQQQQCGGDRNHPDEAVEQSGCGDGEHDALDRGHDLAPVPGWQRCGQPRYQPARQQQRVAGGADEQHPAAVVLGHIDAEQQDEERVNLAVEAGAQRGGGASPPRHLAVHRVEDQRAGGQGDQRRDRHRPAERVGNQARDPGDQQRPGQGDPVRRMYRRLVAAHPGGDKQRGRRRTGGQPGDPAGDAETSRGGHDAEQGGCGEQPQDRREPNRRQRALARERSPRRRAFVRRLNRTHRASVPVASAPSLMGTTGPRSRWFTATGRGPVMLPQPDG